MTRGFEGSQVGATPIEEGMPQKTGRKKLLVMRNGTPPDVRVWAFFLRRVCHKKPDEKKKVIDRECSEETNFCRACGFLVASEN